MIEILRAIEQRKNLVETFGRLEQRLAKAPAKDLEPVIRSAIAVAEDTDEYDVRAALNRVLTQFCERSLNEGKFLYDLVLDQLEHTDWDDTVASERSYRLVETFKGHHVDFMGSNMTLRKVVRQSCERIVALTERLLATSDRTLAGGSANDSRLGDVLAGLIELVRCHSNWEGDEDLRKRVAPFVVPIARRFPHAGSITTLGLLGEHEHADRWHAELIDLHVTRPDDSASRMLGVLAMEMMEGGVSDRLSSRIPAIVDHLRPLATRWTAAQWDRFVVRFLEQPFASDQHRVVTLTRSSEKHALAEFVSTLGRESSKVEDVARWLEQVAELKRGQGQPRAAQRPAHGGVIFKDFNFKLLVIDALMYQKHVLEPKFDVYDFAKTYTERSIDVELDGYDVIPEVQQYFEMFPLTKHDLAKVTRIVVDGALEIYQQIYPFWDGEDDSFALKSVDDIQYLPNLKHFQCDVIAPKLKAKLTRKGIMVES